jgi:transposase
MDTIFSCVAGLDVHKKTVAACIRRVNKQGKTTEEVRTFGTMTKDLLALLDWLQVGQVTHVAMEATGVLWKPVYNILEGHFELVLVNPRDIKKVPGRKTDVLDSQWIAQLMGCGLLTGSFIAPKGLRELRELTRLRAQLLSESTRVANRIHKVLEDANIKLSVVASDILGVSGRAMLEALVSGNTNPAEMAELARGSLKRKIPLLTKALDGYVSENHRFILGNLLDHLQYLEGQIAQFSQRIEEMLLPFLPTEQQENLDEIPGVNQRTIENIIAEIGTDMDRFPSSRSIASWSGICPGNEESAGKRKRARITHGNVWLRRALAEAAWAASHTKDTYLSAQYRRLAGRRGKKRALIAVAHTILTIIYHMLKRNSKYHELGPDYYDTHNRRHAERYLVKRLQQLGYEVQLVPKPTAA